MLFKMAQLSNLAKELYKFLLKHENGASNKQIQDDFAAPFDSAGAAMNELLKAHKVDLFAKGGINFVCRVVKGEVPAKLEGIE